MEKPSVMVSITLITAVKKTIYIATISFVLSLITFLSSFFIPEADLSQVHQNEPKSETELLHIRTSNAVLTNIKKDKKVDFQSQEKNFPHPTINDIRLNTRTVISPHRYLYKRYCLFLI